MLCPKCGCHVPNRSKFCLECGCDLTQTKHDKHSHKLTSGGAGSSSSQGATDIDEEPSADLGFDENDDWAAIKPMSSDGDLVFKPLQYPEPVTLKTLRNKIHPTSEDSITVSDTASADETANVDETATTNSANAENTNDGANDNNGEDTSNANGDNDNDADTNKQPSINADDNSDFEPIYFEQETEIIGSEVLETTRQNQRGKFPYVVGGVIAGIVALIVVINIFAFINAPYEINMKTFPDEGLRNAVLALDDDGDGRLRRDQIPQITSLEVEYATDISGLQIFENLQYLEAYGEHLKSVDVSNVPSLKTLVLRNSGVENVNVTGLSELQSLDVQNTPIATLDLTGTSSLSTLNVHSTKIEQLDLSSCSSLSNIQMNDNLILTGTENTQILQNWFVTSYSCGEGAEGDKPTMSANTKYNEDGKISEVEYSSSDESANYVYSYDEGGKLVSLNEYPSSRWKSGASYQLAYDEGGKLVSSQNATTGENYQYHYDDQNRISGFDATINNSLKIAEKYARGFEYNENGYLSKITGSDASSLVYDQSGMLTSYTTDDGKYAYKFVYDEQGRCIESNIKTDNGACRETYSYDENGKMNNATRALSDNVNKSFELPAVTSTQFGYDVYGNLTSLVMYDGESQIGWCHFSYTRTITSKDKAVVGTVPTQTDPLWYTTSTSCIWTPWLFKRQSAESQDALLMVFNEDQVWSATHNPIIR